MLKKYKKTVILTTLVALLPMLAGLLLWNQLPETIAIHFGANGEPNGWSSRGMAVFGLPAFIAAVNVLCAVGTSADPKKQNIQPKIFKLILWICPLCSWLCCGMTYVYSLGVTLSVEKIAMVFCGVVFIIIGNYLPKCRQSYTVGIKLPWTLASEDNWNRTHRMAGGLWMVGGAVVLLMGLTGKVYVAVFLSVTAVMVLVPTIYSYLLYRKLSN
jgi:uncharacterized membrane protein